MLRTYLLVAACVILSLSHSFNQVSACPLDACPTGQSWMQRAGYNHSSNGCGSYGISVEAPFMANECCHAHDACYANCSNSLEFCNEVFHDCLNRNCETYYDGDGLSLRNETAEAACEVQADLFYAAVEGLGCSTYRSSQERGCECMNGNGTDPTDTSRGGPNSALSLQSLDNGRWNILIVVLMTIFTQTFGSLQ